MKKHIKKSIDGFGNDGKFYAYYNKLFDEKTIDKIDIVILQDMAHISFGYQEPRFEIEYSIKDAHLKAQCNRNTATLALKKLINLKLIERVEWQSFGPKQTYKYKVMLPKGYKIDLGSVVIEEEPEQINKFF